MMRRCLYIFACLFASVLFASPEGDAVIPLGYYSSHEGAFHRLHQISVSGGQMSLNDGSVWKVLEKDRHKTIDWMMNDVVLICPNYRPFSSCNYKLYNEVTDSRVEVNLYRGPKNEGKETYKIVLIGY